ncbi:MAG TPA: hypothetical protein V6D28_08780 [Leptolyngbyaceae cyanobacterium]|nr:hypothetical protein [Nostocaceae cyanobacterium]
MQSVKALLEKLKAQNALIDTVNYPRIQFGTKARRYRFSELLPEKRVTKNEYREEEISYRTIMANSGTRYSPVVIKGGAAVGSMLVELGNSDIGAEFTGQALDSLMELLNTNAADMQEAERQIINFTDRAIGRALAEYREKQRCDAIVDAQFVRQGYNGYREVVDCPNPEGHRVTIPSGTKTDLAGWYDPTYNPMEDIANKISWLRSEKGLIVTRIMTSLSRKLVLARNPFVQAYGSGITVVQGQLQGTGPSGIEATVDAAFAKEKFPPVETYDLRYYESDSSSHRFLKESAFVMLCETGRETAIDLGDEAPIPMYDTLGYTAIGRAVGQTKPGVVVRSEYKEDKPPRIEFEGWQTSLPVLQDPEAIAVFDIPEPSNN